MVGGSVFPSRISESGGRAGWSEEAIEAESIACGRGWTCCLHFSLPQEIGGKLQFAHPRLFPPDHPPITLNLNESNCRPAELGQLLPEHGCLREGHSILHQTLSLIMLDLDIWVYDGYYKVCDLQFIMLFASIIPITMYQKCFQRAL